jgi:GPI mannosyltransferase 1 subunit M
MAPKLLQNTRTIFLAATVIRIILLLWSSYQDTHSPVKYTDIDYFVFTDASRFVAAGHSPYDRETYRYTPLLAWLLLPTTQWFEFGKALFAAADILAGWLLLRILKEEYGLDQGRAIAYASVWLLNPMVAGISTRGSCEGLLGVLAAGLLLAILRRKTLLAGVILGFAVHFKIYPFIYASSIIWWLESEEEAKKGKRIIERIFAFCNRDRVVLVVTSFSTFMVFNLIMYSM